jgi:uncharacterized protein YcgL (UPF0745 family)
MIDNLLDQIIEVYEGDKSGIFLYLRTSDGWNRVPDALKSRFSSPRLVLKFSLKSRKKIARVLISDLIEYLKNDGYYLQIPQSETNLLDEWIKNKT